MAKRKKNKSQARDDDMMPLVRHKPKSRHPHVAEEYLSMGSRSVAESLVRQLRPDARSRVIG